MKYFRMSYEEVVFNRSYINIILLNRSISSYNLDKDDDKERDGKPNVSRYQKPRDFNHESELFSSLM